jgi:FAD/FMN-containing dehydrogenase
VRRRPLRSQSGRSIPESVVSGFAKHLSGRLVRAGDSGYDSARQVWLRALDRRPALVAQCACAADVAAAIHFARDNGVLVAVRGGGHTSFATCNDGLVIDLGRMKSAEISADGRYVRADPGLTCGELDALTHPRGLAVPLAECPGTGIGGVTLGGGIGYLLGSYGLTCDNLVSAEVIDARGRSLIASEDHDAELFWALRGGGGNFGVATSLTFRLHPVREVIAGMLTYAAAEVASVLRGIGEFAEEAPDPLALVAMNDLRFTPAQSLTLLACWSGSPDEGERVLKRIRGLGAPRFDDIRPRSWLEMQQVLDVGPLSVGMEKDIDFISGIDEQTADALAARIVDTPALSCGLALELFHGAASRIAVHETAFPVRRRGFFVHMTGPSGDDESRERTSAVLQRVRDALRPVSTGDTYLNGLGLNGEVSESRVARGYGANYARLRQLKRNYDPDNFFRLNPNVKPADKV